MLINIVSQIMRNGNPFFQENITMEMEFCILVLLALTDMESDHFSGF